MITGLVQGFHVGLTWLPKVSFVCNNLYSALKEHEITDTLLTKEVKKGFLLSPFDKSPFPFTPIIIPV